MAETSSLLNCRTGNRTTSSNLVASAVRVAKTYDGAIAQLVEQRTENPCVPGSIPGGTTKKKRGIATQQRVMPLFFRFPSPPVIMLCVCSLSPLCWGAVSWSCVKTYSPDICIFVKKTGCTVAHYMVYA